MHRFGGCVVANVEYIFTLGLSNSFISIFKDIVAVISILLSFLLPRVMLVLVILLVLFFSLPSSISGVICASYVLKWNAGAKRIV